MKGQILFDSGSNIVVTGGPDNLTK
jgi:hypothetical protein